MQQTLIILKPSAVQRGLAGRIIDRFLSKGLVISGLKMMQLTEPLLREHYAHLVDKPFFPTLMAAMMASPVIVGVVSGKDAVNVVRLMAGPTNGRDALPGTIRGDFAMSNQENIIHASDSPENAALEIARFFKPEEVFEAFRPVTMPFIYGPGEAE